MTLRRKLQKRFQRLVGHLTKRYFVEDYVRVYPDGMVFDRSGKPSMPTPDSRKNFLNHTKFYRFCAQFVDGRKVADIGCGSGYGCSILKDAGASWVWGADLSQHAIDFAQAQYGDEAQFTQQAATDLNGYSDGQFDVSICSEVLEHLKPYGVERQVLRELRRITQEGGLIIVGTPNTELLPRHGFSFDEIDGLFREQFSQYCILENALVPYGERRQLWDARLAAGQVGRIVSQKINLEETVLKAGAPVELKKGLPVGELELLALRVDTRKLHNTHSWVVLARNDSVGE